MLLTRQSTTFDNCSLRWGMPRISLRNSSERIELSGVFSPAAAKRSTMPSGAV